MKMSQVKLNHYSTILILLYFLGQIEINCQETTTTESTTASTTTTPVPARNHSVLETHICNPKDSTSFKYCTCSDEVVSCDFSTFPGSNLEQTTLNIFGDDLLPSAKRLCFCSSPRHLRLNLSSLNGDGHLKISSLDNFHRLDIFNIKGPLILQQALASNFNGDVYMKNVADLHSLVSWSFGRGLDFQIKNVQNLDCCSKINVPLEQYSRPILYLEDVTIGTIKSRGIDSIHLWRTIILKDISILKNVETQGIVINSQNVNVSITGSIFRNISNSGIRIEKFENLLFAKNHIDEDSNLIALELMSNIPNSSLVFVSNEISNGLIWSFDAQRVVNWFNYYYYWDEYTFINLSRTSLNDRIISIEYNDIEYYLMKNATSFPSMGADDEIIINENVFGQCNCTMMKDVVYPQLLNAHMRRCDPKNPFQKNVENKPPGPEGAGAGLHCLIDLDIMPEKCSSDENESIDFIKLCHTHGIMTGGDNSKKIKIKGTHARISSPFIHDMVKGMKFNDFDIHQIFQDEYLLVDKRTGSTSSNGILYVFLIMFLILGILIAGIFLIRRRKRGMRMSIRSSFADSYDVLTSTTTT